MIKNILLGFTAVAISLTVGGYALAPDASALSARGKIKVEGRVLPKHTIILDEQGKISEILSNTDQDVRPTVYKLASLKSNEVPLSEEIYQQYRKIIPSGSSKVGVLYKAEPAKTAQKNNIAGLYF